MLLIGRGGKCITMVIIVSLLESVFLPSVEASVKLTTLAVFDGGDGNTPTAGVVEDSNGDLFGTTTLGYNNNIYEGTAYEVPAGSNSVTVLSYFDSTGNVLVPGNGISTSSPLVMSSAGNMYGLTGRGPSLSGNNSYGTLYEISGVSHTVSTLVDFNNTDGAGPRGSLVFDSQGNLYGTTGGGGSSGDGTVFELPAGSQTPTTLASFTGMNGSAPNGLIADASGNLYGVTTSGGVNGKGTVFEITADTHTFSTIASFNSTHGDPGGLAVDANGDLFGYTQDFPANFGEIFEIPKISQNLTPLAYFGGSNIGPSGNLVVDAAGNLFGTTSGDNYDTGTIFELSAGSSTLSTLWSFNVATNGAVPFSGLVADSNGDLFGTASQGGTLPNGQTGDNGTYGDGTVFEVTGTGFVVPEPASVSLIGLAGIGLLALRKARHR